MSSPWHPALAPVTLGGAWAILEPLQPAHHDELVEAVRDGELWNLWYTPVPSPATMRAEIERRLSLQERGSMLPFAVRERTGGKVAGMTTYMNVDLVNHRLEIGSTWYRKRVQRTPLNTECKMMLLEYAFETLEAIAVEFRTSSFNRPSRSAIERLGAKLDGILRNHSLHPDGTLRDTYVYSILPHEWPAVRSNLTSALER